MNDDRLLLEMRRWLQEERVALPDAEEAGRRIAAKLPTTRQRRRRWWRLPRLARTPRPSGTRDTTEYQPSPVPATNGHTPTAIGRTTSMLSPVKAITAGAVIFAISGAFLIAQPFGQQGRVPGAEAPAPLPPEPFSGIVHCGGQVAFGTSESLEFPMGEANMTVVSERGDTWRPSAPGMSDPRLQGNYAISFDTDAYYPPGVVDSLDVIGAGTWRIENDEGAWQGSYHIVGGAPVVVPLVGEGAYDGLTAIVESAFSESDCAWEWSGLIIDRGLPEYPEPPAE